MGIAANYGAGEANPPVTWSDGTLSFAFKIAPSASDPNSPLAVLGHDGGSTAFAPWRNAYVESLGRTWFISESNPARGGVLSFSFEMAANDNKRYVLNALKVPGGTLETTGAPPSCRGRNRRGHMIGNAQICELISPLRTDFWYNLRP